VWRAGLFLHFKTLCLLHSSTQWTERVLNSWNSSSICKSLPLHVHGKLRSVLQTPHVSCLISRATISPTLKRSECQADYSLPSIVVLLNIWSFSTVFSTHHWVQHFW
jgi:hypothetical protein